MRRVHGQRRQQRKDVGDEMFAQCFRSRSARSVYLTSAYRLRIEQFEQLKKIWFWSRCISRTMTWLICICSMGVRPSTVCVLNARGDLLFQSADALHEKFIQIAADNGKELDALEQGCLFISGHVQHAAVEFQPRQFAVEIKLGGVEVDDVRRGRVDPASGFLVRC